MSIVKEQTYLVIALSFLDELDYFLGRLLFVGDCHGLLHLLGADQLNIAIFIIVHLRERWHEIREVDIFVIEMND